MLAVNILKYWWLKPQLQDPRHYETHDPLRSISLSSFLEPHSGPQFEKEQKWSRIPNFYGGKDPMQRSIIEIEKDIAEGKDLILVEPEMAGQVYYHYIAHGWVLLENSIFYGGMALAISYFYPKKWFISVPCAFLALMHSYVYFRVYKYDRVSVYQAYDDDRHPVSNLVTAWVLGQRPAHFQYVLKKQSVGWWELFSEAVLYSSLYSTVRSLAKIETYVLGEGKLQLGIDPEKMVRELLTPAYRAGYFRPPDLVPVSARYYLPTDIPFVRGWFDLPFINFRPKPMRYDRALIMCALGLYFFYKGFQHFFGVSEEDEVDEVGREWIRSDEERKKIFNTPKDPYWIELSNDYEEVTKPTDPAIIQKLNEERDEVTKITSRAPYGWVPPGYPDNHYGIYM